MDHLDADYTITECLIAVGNMYLFLHLMLYLVWRHLRSEHW